MFNKKLNQNALELPPIAQTDPKAIEVLRVWAVPDGPNQVILRTTWEESGAWGLLLVDVARHAANAYAREGLDPNVVLARIRELFDVEWNNPTDTPQDITE